MLAQLLPRAISHVIDRDVLISALDDRDSMVRYTIMGSLCLLSRLDMVVRDVLLSRIPGSWPLLDPGLPVQVAAVPASMIRLMNVADPKVWAVLRPKAVSSRAHSPRMDDHRHGGVDSAAP